VAYESAAGRQLWLHADKARYHTTIAGEGPRATPTILGNRVFTWGATGILNCLDLATGRRIWARNVVAESGGKIPQWGCASSPLLVNGLVMVHGGEQAQRSLHAFRADDGLSVWSAGNRNPSYASPSFAVLAGVPQVLAFNDGSISAHEPATGATLWEIPWGNGNVVCASPVAVGENRVLFSSGYGVGAELLEIGHDVKGRVQAERVWKSIRMKSKFAHLFVRDGCLFGLDDGIFTCVDLRDGAQRWKEGRYGHGQGLLVGDLYLLMAESGELVLMHPTPDAPNELARFRVFNSKTWNPLALSGNWLLARNDREAVCLRLKIAP
jgi:outer membrane protein assembly factor BamB